MMMTFAKLDMVSIDGWWAENFEFVPTTALNAKFELSGMETKGFLFNSGSLLPNIAGGMAQSFLFALLVRVVFRYCKTKRSVNFVVKRALAPPVKSAIQHLLYQFTIDVVICSLLQFSAYGELGFAVFLAKPVERLSLALAILFLVACLGVTAFSLRLVQTSEDMDSKAFQREYSVFVEGLRVDHRLKAQYHNLKIVKKLALATILILL